MSVCIIVCSKPHLAISPENNMNFKGYICINKNKNIRMYINKNNLIYLDVKNKYTLYFML